MATVSQSARPTECQAAVAVSSAASQDGGRAAGGGSHEDTAGRERLSPQ